MYVRGTSQQTAGAPVHTGRESIPKWLGATARLSLCNLRLHIFHCDDAVPLVPPFSNGKAPSIDREGLVVAAPARVAELIRGDGGVVVADSAVKRGGAAAAACGAPGCGAPACGAPACFLHWNFEGCKSRALNPKAHELRQRTGS